MPEQGLTISLRTAMGHQSTKRITGEQWTHLANRLPHSYFAIFDSLSLKDLYFLLERVIIGDSSVQKRFQFVDLLFVPARRFEFSDLLLVSVAPVPASRNLLLLIT